MFSHRSLRASENLVKPVSSEPSEGIHGFDSSLKWASLIAQLVKKPPAMQETWVGSQGQEYLLEKGLATHPSILRLPLWLSW